MKPFGFSISVLLIIGLLSFSCQEKVSHESNGFFNSVSGSHSIDSLGLTLIHEHMLVDFIGADSVSEDRYNRDSVVQKVLPYLLEVRKLGVKTIFDCTPSYLGKDPELLKILSEKSGIQLVTNTGYYGAVDGKYLPKHAFSESAEELAARWIDEFENGISSTGIKPGFIKISVNAEEPLRDVDSKLVRAAGITFQKTGLQIVSHTGPWFAASQEVAVLQEMGIDPSAFVWVHAQNEPDFENFKKAAELGVWISWDGIGWEVDSYVDRLLFAKENDFLDQVLISHDAGWYKPGEANGGDFQPFTAIFTDLVPKLDAKGFTKQDWETLLIDNPKQAFGLSN
ncbi:MAG: phosphotriesterase [Algoriphagus sp.]|uniref:phosphotriesterase family protein n=1 Tax=Algoriphagus sp. TaxID=1872435 RepID=UPI00260E8127|nr:phosphotriesterase [Algoriphagus sp.]MDG1277704.1 phosphotriesterase [Algoriphagus sp.]